VALGFADTTQPIDENLAAYDALAAVDEAGRWPARTDHRV
jgi:hypothetical protein